MKTVKKDVYNELAALSEQLSGIRGELQQLNKQVAEKLNQAIKSARTADGKGYGDLLRERDQLSDEYRALLEPVHKAASDYYSARSNSWQESVTGIAYEEWMESWGCEASDCEEHRYVVIGSEIWPDTDQVVTTYHISNLSDFDINLPPRELNSKPQNDKEDENE